MIARVVNKGILCCRMISSKGPSGDGWLTVAGCGRTSNVASVIINDTDIADERERGDLSIIIFCCLCHGK